MKGVGVKYSIIALVAAMAASLLQALIGQVTGQGPQDRDQANNHLGTDEHLHDADCITAPLALVKDCSKLSSSDLFRATVGVSWGGSGMDKWWKYVERACIFGGVLIGLGALYFEAGNYYGWNRTQPVPQTAGPIMALGSVWPIALAAISAALIFTGWGMIYARARRPKRANAALVKSLSVAEQQFNLAIRTFVLSKLDAAVKGYMGVFHEFINRYMAEDDARKLSDRQWAGLSQFSQVAVAMSLTANFEQLRAMFSDPEGQIDAASAQAAIDRFLNIYSGTKQHMLLLLPQISGARFNDHNLQIWHQAEALHGRHPRLGCVSHRRGKIPSGSGLPLGNNHEKLTPLTAGTNIPLKQILGLQRPAMARPKISGFLRPQR